MVQLTECEAVLYSSYQDEGLRGIVSTEARESTNKKNTYELLIDYALTMSLRIELILESVVP